MRWARLALWPALLCAIVLVFGCEPRLPERNSSAAQLYVSRCGSCHQAYLPQSMTPAMWQLQMAAMIPKLAAAGRPPLSAGEQQQLLAYLEEHAGSQ